MKRTALAFSLLAAVGGCMSTEGGGGPVPLGGGAGGGPGGPGGAPGCVGPGCTAMAPATVPWAMGPNGAPVPVRGGYGPPQQPSGQQAALATISQGLPPEIVQQVALKGGGNGGLMQAGGAMSGGGAGVIPTLAPPGGVVPAGYPNGAVAAVGALTGGNYAGQFQAQRTSVRFLSPAGLKVSWEAQTADGKQAWNETPLEAPATYNFAQGAIYRLKLTDIPDYPGVPLYPTLEVVPANMKAMTFLAHSSVPVSFTADDFRMVSSNNYVVKVIYLPDPQYQDIAVAGGLGELISTQLEPGVDPIAEACKRGSILLIVRLGNINLELPYSPPMNAPPPRPAPPPGMMPQGMGMAPPGMMPPGMMPGAGRGMMTLPPGMMGPPPGMMMPGNPNAAPPRGLPTNLPPANNPGAALPPLPPQTNPLTPAQMAAQGAR